MTIEQLAIRAVAEWTFSIQTPLTQDEVESLRETFRKYLGDQHVQSAKAIAHTALETLRALGST